LRGSPGLDPDSAAEQQAVGRDLPLPPRGRAAVVEEPEPLEGYDGLADGAQHGLVLEGTRPGMNGHGLGLQQGLHVRRQATTHAGPDGGQDLGLQGGEGGGPGRGAGLAVMLRGGPQGGEFLGGRGLEDAVQARGNPEPDRRRVGDLLHLREGLADGVAHALHRPAGDLHDR
jgi:hypothetical protein